MTSPVWGITLSSEAINLRAGNLDLAGNLLAVGKVWRVPYMRGSGRARASGPAHTRER